MLQSVKPSFFRASSNLIDSHLKLGRFPSHRHFLNIIFKSTTPNNGKFEALGQPHPHSHPHLFKSKNDIIPGISRAEFELRRQLLVDQLPDDSLVAIPGNHEQPMTGSINFPFHQQADFYYLTGFMEPDSTLLLEIPKQATGERVSKKFNFALFVPPRDPNTEMWDGPITGVERVTTHFGAHVAHSSQELKTYLKNLRKFSNVFLPKSEGSISKIMPSITEIFERSRIKPLTPRLHEMRMTKSASEIGLMKSACSISALAHVATMKFAGNELKAKGHVLEQDLHAEFISSSMKLGAKILSYPPVVAGGNRANTLHYVANDQTIADGELVLIDAGAEYFGYCGDITRTFPVSGKFSDAQREIYEAVLRTNILCIEKVSKRGHSAINLAELHRYSQEILGDELRNLGLNKNLVRTFYPHNIGHYLGLDVHDTSEIQRNQQFKEGMIITIEPGLYIPENNTEVPEKYRGIGIRIEDDVLITEQSCQVLTHQVPKKAKEIEELIQK